MCDQLACCSTPWATMNQKVNSLASSENIDLISTINLVYLYQHTHALMGSQTKTNNGYLHCKRYEYCTFIHIKHIRSQCIWTLLHRLRGSQYTSQISHLLLYPSLSSLATSPWIEQPFSPLLLTFEVGNNIGKWLQDFVSFVNPLLTVLPSILVGYWLNNTSSQLIFL